MSIASRFLEEVPASWSRISAAREVPPGPPPAIPKADGRRPRRRLRFRRSAFQLRRRSQEAPKGHPPSTASATAPRSLVFGQKPCASPSCQSDDVESQAVSTTPSRQTPRRPPPSPPNRAKRQTSTRRPNSIDNIARFSEPRRSPQNRTRKAGRCPARPFDAGAQRRRRPQKGPARPPRKTLRRRHRPHARRRRRRRKLTCPLQPPRHEKTDGEVRQPEEM